MGDWGREGEGGDGEGRREGRREGGREGGVSHIIHIQRRLDVAT